MYARMHASALTHAATAAAAAHALSGGGGLVVADKRMDGQCLRALRGVCLCGQTEGP
jgi:hypothetical protein